MKQKSANAVVRKTNPVAKNARQFHRTVIFRDRKKAEKRGYSRHKPDFAGSQGDYENVLPGIFS